MKRTYAFLMSGVMLMSVSLAGCSSETTTGVDTQTTANEVDGELNDPEGGAMTQDNISPLDTANGGGANSGTDMSGGNSGNAGGSSGMGNSNSATGNDTTPSTDNGN